MQNNNSGCLSWPAIIIALIFCWPVGLVLLIKRFSNDKSAIMSEGKGVRAAAIILLVIGILAFIGLVTDYSPSSGGIFVSLLIIGGGVALLVYSSKMKRLGIKYKAYINLIVNNNQGSLDAISTIMNIPYALVYTDLKMMISKGYFPNAYIDENERRIILSQIPAQPVQSFGARGTFINVAGSPQNNVRNAPQQPRVISCPSCSANNTITGPVGTCEYCGSPIQ